MTRQETLLWSGAYLVELLVVLWFTRATWARAMGALTGGAVVAIIGPPRDYFIAARFPKWMVFSPGFAPILADAVTHMAIVALGHGVMHLISGPARGDRLARTPRETI